MIHTITVRNFQSIADEATLDFTINRKASENNMGYISASTQSRLSLVQAIVGGNASGKTTILKALSLIRWINADSFNWSHERRLPIKGFALSKKTLKKPTELSVVFEIDDTVHEYFVSLNSERILREELNIKNLTSKRVTTKKVFARKWNVKDKKYEIIDSYFKLKEPYWISGELCSTSIILAAAKFGNERATTIVNYWRKLKTNLDIDDRFMPYQYQAFRAMDIYERNQNMREQAEADVRKYDLGIQSFGKDGKILHKHGDSTFELNISEESSGTQQFIALKQKIDRVLERGGMAVIDELDAFLHPKMSEDIINKFLNPKINKGKGQLLFSTHDLQVLNLLDPYQISLAKKDKMGVTKLKRLDSEKIRSSDNRIKRYLNGEYGGIQIFDN